LKKVGHRNFLRSKNRVAKFRGEMAKNRVSKEGFGIKPRVARIRVR